MLPSKFMLFAVVALVIVNGAIAIIGGQSATPGQFPYFVLLKTTRTNEPVNLLYLYKFFLKKNLNLLRGSECEKKILSKVENPFNIPHYLGNDSTKLWWSASFGPVDCDKCPLFGIYRRYRSTFGRTKLDQQI